MSAWIIIEKTDAGFVVVVLGHTTTSGGPISRPAPRLCDAVQYRALWIKSRDEQLTVDELIALGQFSPRASFFDDEIASAERTLAQWQGMAARYQPDTMPAEVRRGIEAAAYALATAHAARSQQPTEEKGTDHP